MTTGQDGNLHRQDKTGHPYRPLRRERAGRQRDTGCRGARRLSDRCRLLNSTRSCALGRLTGSGLDGYLGYQVSRWSCARRWRKSWAGDSIVRRNRFYRVGDGRLAVCVTISREEILWTPSLDSVPQFLSPRSRLALRQKLPMGNHLAPKHPVPTPQALSSCWELGWLIHSFIHWPW